MVLIPYATMFSIIANWIGVYIFLFTVSCDRAAQSITLKLEIKAKNQKPQAKNIYTHKINIDTHTHIDTHTQTK